MRRGLLLTPCVFLLFGCGADAPNTAEYEGVTDWCEPTFEWDAQYKELEEDVLLATNEARAAGANCGGDEMPPVGPLVMQAQLRCAARMHSRSMSLEDFFDHDSLNGDSPWDRMEKAGYERLAAGENIARGQASAQSVVDGWMNSPGHCANIMNADFTELGVGYYDGNHWTQAFASPAN